MSPLRVLVAEDNEDHRYLMVRALKKVAQRPLEIHEARDGEETLDFLCGDIDHEQRPHLVFLDLKMPRMNGLEVLKRLRADPDASEIPVVVVTASSRREDIDTAYALGTNSFVTKADDVRNTLPQVAEYWTVRAQLPHVQNGGRV